MSSPVTVEIPTDEALGRGRRLRWSSRGREDHSLTHKYWGGALEVVTLGGSLNNEVVAEDGFSILGHKN